MKWAAQPPKCAVVTGATGFIGRHLIRGLLSRGVTVFAIGRSRPSGLPDDPLLYFLRGSMEDRDQLKMCLPDGPDAFFHLAWSGTAPEQRNDPDVQLENIALSIDAVRLAASIGAKRFILPGSTSEFAFCEGGISPEAFPKPQNIFGAVKAATRILCRRLCEDLSLSFIYVVITGVYGADRKDNNVITYTISQLLDKKRPSFTELEQLWDYVHIDDAVEALYLVAAKGKDGGFYMVGHGDNWPLANYIYQIRDIIDPTLPLGIGDKAYDKGAIPGSCVDLTSIREDTGFVPKIAFSDGIAEVIDRIKQERMSENSV